MRHFITIAVFLIGILISMLHSPQIEFTSQSVYVSPISVAEAGEILFNAAYSHQYFVDRPGLIPQYTPRSSVQLHQNCVDRYAQIWQLIQGLRQ